MKNYKKKQLGKLSSLLILIPVIGLGYGFDLAEEKGWIATGVFESPVVNTNNFVNSNASMVVQNHGRMSSKNREFHAMSQLTSKPAVDTKHLNYLKNTQNTPLYIKTNLIVPKNK